MIEVECECGRVIKTNDANAGKKARCPECGEIVEIPAPRKASGKSPAPAAKGAATGSVKTARKRTPSEDEYQGDDDDFGDGDGEELPELPRSKKLTGKGSKSKKGEGEASSKKKKQQEADDAELNRKLLIGTGVVFGLAFLGLIGWGIASMGSVASAPKMEVPKEYVSYSSPNGELTCEGPKGWDLKTGGGSGGTPPFLTLEQGGVKIQFRASPSGSMMSTIMQPNGDDGKPIPDEEKPVSKIHEMQKERYAQDISGYEEQGAPTMIKTGGGEGRLSAFTASEGMLSKTFGYRCTLVGNNNQWTVLCKCSANDWKDYQAVFRKVIESTRGT